MLSTELAAALEQVTTDAIVEAFPSKYNNKNKYFIKQKVSIHEYNMHVLVYYLRLIRVPHPIYYDRVRKCMVMEKIHGTNLSDKFGDCACDVPVHIREDVLRMIRILTSYQIQYVDITGYNFVIDARPDGRIWLVDFEHAYESEEVPQCVEMFCVTSADDMEWNAEFK